MSAPVLDIRPSSWVVKNLPHLTGGLNTSVPSWEIADDECTICSNLRFKHGLLIVDTGYTKLGQVIRGIPKGLFTHQRATGVAEALLVTDATCYRYVVAVNQWQYVRTTIHTTVAANEIAGATAIDVANTAGFIVGDHVGIDLDDGNQHQTTILAIPTPGAPGVITITAGLPSASSIGKAFIRALVLTGNNDNQVVWVAVPSHEWSVFTNGVNPPHRYDGTDVRPIPNLPFGGNLVCKTLSMIRDAYLVLLNLIEGGVSAPYKLMWSSAGDPTNWTTGDSGDNSLVDSRDALVAAKPLLGDLVIYRTSSIVLMEFAGLPFFTFRFMPINFGTTIAAEGVGCVSPNAVFAFTDVHLVVGRSRIYVYRGGSSTDTISAKIFPTFFGVGAVTNRDRLGASFVFYDEFREEIYFCFPGGTDIFCRSATVLDLNTGTFRVRNFAHALTAAGSRPLTQVEAVRIIDLVGTIIEQSWVIGGAGVPSSGNIIDLCGESPLQVYEYDLASSTDDGVAIVWSITLKAFRLMDRFVRLDFIEVEASGPGFSISTLSGGVFPLFNLYATIGSDSLFRRVRSYKQIVVEGAQIRIAGTSSGTAIRHLTFKYRPESRWAM